MSFMADGRNDLRDLQAAARRPKRDWQAVRAFMIATTDEDVVFATLVLVDADAPIAPKTVALCAQICRTPK